MTITIEPGNLELHAPAIVTREQITTDVLLRRDLTRFGFGSLARIEQPNDVLVATTDAEGKVLAAGMLVLSRHLMQHPELSKPEIHVHAGVDEIVTTREDGSEFIHWGINDASRGAATLTLDALVRIAHIRDENNVKVPVIGLPQILAWALKSGLLVLL